MNLYDGSGAPIVISNGKNVLQGKNVVILADSLFDYEQPESMNIGDYLQLNHECTVHNWAQGGCCMALGKATNYDPYSFVGLVDALTSGDFTDQIANAEERSFTEQVADMQSFDMSACDFMVVAYGTNDFWRPCVYEDDSNDEDPYYFSGAIRYGIKTLLSAYPEIKLLFLNLQNMGSTYIETAAWYNATGSHYAESAKYNNIINEVCAERSVPVLDIWGSSMVYGQIETVYHAGKPHLSRLGKIKYATMIANALNLYY